MGKIYFLHFTNICSLLSWGALNYASIEFFKIFVFNPQKRKTFFVHFIISLWIEMLSGFAHQFKLSINSFMNIQRTRDSLTKTYTEYNHIETWICFDILKYLFGKHTTVHCHFRPVVWYKYIFQSKSSEPSTK